MLKLIGKVLKVLIGCVLILIVACIAPKIYDVANKVLIENGTTSPVYDVRFTGFDQAKEMGTLSPASHKQLLFWTPKRSSTLTLSYRLEGKEYTQKVGEATQGMGWGRWRVSIEKDGNVTVHTRFK